MAAAARARDRPTRSAFGERPHDVDHRQEVEHPEDPRRLQLNRERDARGVERQQRQKDRGQRQATDHQPCFARHGDAGRAAAAIEPAQ